jgi:hypothetical protein
VLPLGVVAADYSLASQRESDANNKNDGKVRVGFYDSMIAVTELNETKNESS